MTGGSKPADLQMVSILPRMPAFAMCLQFQIGSDTKLALADSVVLATARQSEATLWTQDADFEGLPDVKFRAKKSAVRPG